MFDEADFAVVTGVCSVDYRELHLSHGLRAMFLAFNIMEIKFTYLKTLTIV